MNKDEILLYTRNASLIILALVSIIFPSFFLTNATEIFVFPKQLLVIYASVLLLFLYCVRTIVEGKITIKASPFNLPVIILAIVFFASSLFSRNMFDSLLQSLPIIMILVLYFAVINTITDKLSLKIVEFSLLVGGLLSSIIAILQYLKIYIFPIEVAQNQFFNPYGSVIQQLIYITPLLVLSVYHLIRQSKLGRFDYNFAIYSVSSVVMSIGVVVASYQILTLPQKPILLPFQYGFQIGLASISQDAPRLIQSFLLGSGFGTFSTAFTRFKPLAFNNEQDLWQLIFSYSTSFFLELVATTGILGTIAFLFLGYRAFKTRLNKMNGIYAAFLIVLLLSFVLPFSYVTIFLLVMMMGLYVSFLYVNKHDSVYDFTLSLLAWRESLMNFANPSEDNPDVKSKVTTRESKYLPIVFTLAMLLFSGFIGYFAARLAMAESKFRDSLSSENLNNGQKTYDLQRFAIADFPYRSDYHRVFSQINLALANSVLTNLPANSSPSAQTQQNVLRLLQQSINSGRNAAQLGPLTSNNWIQLASVYRNLIGVGQNAEGFAVASLQQATALDPYNPNLYIQLGGIYYQLGMYEQAQNNFQTSVQLKPDLANAYYNLGHALEAKGDLQNALTAYQRVKALVSGNKQNDELISKEIDALVARAGGQAQQSQEEVQPTEQPAEQTPLEVNAPSVTLPPRTPQIKLSPPPATITPSTSPTSNQPSGTPTPSQSQ